MARALARIETAPDEAATTDLLDAAYHDAKAQVIGLTGPPGVGKSTLISRLIEALRAEGRSVGVIAIDPSSRRSGGALLGDRVRLVQGAEDPGVFVRSMAARDRLGGLAAEAFAATLLMRAVYDRVIVETVGVGQSETDVAMIADTIVLCVQPGSGDSLQYIKAGIAEIPDIAVIGKADLGGMAARAERDLEAALALARRADGWSVPIVPASGTKAEGIARLMQAMADHGRHLEGDGRLHDRRRAQAERWLAEAIRDELGRHGLERARRAGGLELAPGQGPFGALHRIIAALGERDVASL
jgi:LAO/AO transport system kinase